MVCEVAACGGLTEGTLVVVRAALDEPVAFIAIAAGEVVVQVSNDDPEKHASIGFPRRRAFARDERLLRELRASYELKTPCASHGVDQGGSDARSGRHANRPRDLPGDENAGEAASHGAYAARRTFLLTA